MTQDYLAGDYINYPCPSCGQNLVLKDDLKKLPLQEKATIECQDCGLEKEYTVAEMKAIINAAS
jgi:transcription elongation factor Elf1